jgi:hypothetical protein
MTIRQLLVISINPFAFNATLSSGPLFKGHCTYASDHRRQAEVVSRGQSECKSEHWRPIASLD